MQNACNQPVIKEKKKKTTTKKPVVSSYNDVDI